jgi:hypothetical protein
VGSDASALENYLALTSGGAMKLDHLDHFALWSLAQMSIRPDQSSASSRLQIIIQHRGENFYFDFFSEGKQGQYPYLYGIEWVLRKLGKKRTLEEYARMLDNSGQQFRVGRDLAAFLTKHKQEIRDQEQLAPLFIRGNEVLKEEETVPRLNFLKLVSNYRRAEKNQKMVVNTSLIPFISEGAVRASCNYDFNLYANSIYLIDKTIPASNLFGLSTAGGSFLAASAQRIDKIAPLDGQPIFAGESRVRSSAVCLVEGEGRNIWSISNHSRDPGQHLFHLFRYGLAQARSVQEVDTLKRYSRHLFLSDPIRLIIESIRSDDAQIADLLKLDLPIYHADKLGNVWTYTQFEGLSRFVVDTRNPGAFLCK